MPTYPGVNQRSVERRVGEIGCVALLSRVVG